MEKEPIPENLVFRYPKGASDERKQEIQEEALDHSSKEFNLEEFPELRKELKKEPWQMDVIDKVDEKIREYFRDKLDLDLLKIKPENIHILEPSDLNAIAGTLEGEEVEGAAAFAHQEHIFLPSTLNKSNLPKIDFTDILIHEYLHTRGFRKIAEVSFEQDSEQEKVVASERQGFSFLNKGQHPPEFYFKALDEGVNARLTTEIFYSILTDDPYYKEEIDAKFSKFDSKISRDEIFKILGVRAYSVEDVDVEKNKDGIGYNWTITDSYAYEQELIDFLCHKIVENKPEKFKNADQVLNLFFRASCRGELLPIAKEIDSVFGKGTFRLLAAIPTAERLPEPNIIVENVFRFLNLPAEQRDPEFARKFIFTQSPKEFEKYLKKTRKPGTGEDVGE